MGYAAGAGLQMFGPKWLTLQQIGELVGMGSSIVKQTRAQLRSDHLNWTILSCSAYCIKVQDKIAGVVGEKYTIEQELLEREWRLYLLRHTHPYYLVTIYDILPEQAATICTTSRQLGIISEHIPYRLADLGAVDHDQALYVLATVLRGYKVLKDSNVDFYLFDEYNVCFNKKGKCKIWINQNLYLARPSVDRRVTERQFLEALFNLLQNRVTDKRVFFLKNLAAVRNLTIDYLLHETEKASTKHLSCMESLKNINTETSRSNNLAFQVQKSYNKIVSPEKKPNHPTPAYSSRRKDEDVQFNVSSSKKLSLANKKKGSNLTENRTINSVKSNKISPKNVQCQLPPKDNTYHSAIFGDGTPPRRKQTCNYSQIFSKKKVNSRQSGGSGGSGALYIPNPNLRKLKFVYNDSSTRL